jgi:anhydro-N-acetylmuramic acid kinase
MTGTSIDGIDGALVEINGHGLEMSAKFMALESRSLGTLAQDLRKLADQQQLSAKRITELAWELGTLHGEIAKSLAGRADAPIDLVCVHGQTVYHGGGRTWQLIQPAPIARMVQAPVVFDLRAADIAAGGQGAPITPIADWVLFRASTSRVVANLGGFCNITWVPSSGGAEAVRGRDVCACNQILDGLARVRLGRKFDEGGHAALKGNVIPAAMEAMVQILREQDAQRRSLGTGDEVVSGWISATAAQPGADVVRTACEAVGKVVGEAVLAASDGEKGTQVIIAGGGVKNRALFEAIARNVSGLPVVESDQYGIPAAGREAMEFAILGALCQDRVPITLSKVTGCTEPAPVSGAWIYP